MTDNGNAAQAAATEGERGKRFVSGIEFPYSDLESAIELGQMIHTRAGSSCDTNELAAWLNQTATGGTFRTRVAAAKLFGLIDTGQGRATLQQLGRDILEGSGVERRARIDAFLNVPLFRAMYDQHKGNVLPPPAAIERQMVEFGVSPKQKERARQTFMKSATFAGFIDQSSGRFVKPGIGGQRDDNPPPPPKPGDGNGGGGGDLPPVDPIIQGLLARLPKSGDVWPEADRTLWLQLLEGSFKIIYKEKAQ